MMIEGSGSGSRAGRPKNTWIRIRIRNTGVAYPGSQTNIFESLIASVWVESSIILSKLAQIIFLRQFKINIIFDFLQQKVGQQIFFTPLFCCCFWIRDRRSGIRDGQKIRIRDVCSHDLVIRLNTVNTFQMVAGGDAGGARGGPVQPVQCGAAEPG
jgi:hypothetical protein